MIVSNWCLFKISGNVLECTFYDNDSVMVNFTIKESERLSFVSMTQHVAVRWFAPEGKRKR